MTINTLADTWAGSPPLGRDDAPLREQVMEALRTAILDFRLLPGQRLVERELIEGLGVSRTTIREALRDLASEGLVDVFPQRGAVVSAPSLSEAEDLYDVRGALECILIERFIDRASATQVDELAAAVEGFAAEAARGMSDPDQHFRRVLDAKDGFYRVLLVGAGSPTLRQLVEGVQARVRVLRTASISEAGRAGAAAEELRGVVAAIADRDLPTAKARYLTHITNAATSGLQHLRKAASDGAA